MLPLCAPVVSMASASRAAPSTSLAGDAQDSHHDIHSGPDRTLINGKPSTMSLLHQSLVDAADAYIRSVQRAPCTNETKVLFAHMDFHGIGNDINMAVRAFQVAMIMERQLVFLPPSVRDRSDASNKWMRSLRLDAEQPWHWLAGAGLPLSSLLVPSSCQKHLGLTGQNILQLVSDGSESDPAITLTRIGRADLAQRSRLWKPIWRVGLHAGAIPAPFRQQGLLWWFQVLTNYLVRVRAPLSTIIEHHPAMRALLQKDGRAMQSCLHGQSKPSGCPPPSTTSLAIGRGWCRKRWCDYIGPGWLPPVWFDIGLHLRIGDACGKYAQLKGQRARKCSDRPTEDAFELMRAHDLRGTVFMASDSQEAVARAHELGSRFGFTVISLSYNRGNIEGTAALDANNHSLGTELARRSLKRDRSVLVETLMDMLLLSRTSVLVGSMMSNFPRTALQMRVQAPIHGEQRYIALDGRTWCTRTSCRMNYSDLFGTV